jgi:hypothetical protein
MLIPNETEQQLAIPRHALRHREADFGVRATGLDHCQTRVRSMEEFTCVAEGEAERFLGVPHRFQAPGEAIEELDELEFPLLNKHDCLENAGWASFAPCRADMLPDRRNGPVREARDRAAQQLR